LLVTCSAEFGLAEVIFLNGRQSARESILDQVVPHKCVHGLQFHWLGAHLAELLLETYIVHVSVEVEDKRLGAKVAFDGVTLHLKADGRVQVAAILAELAKLGIRMITGLLLAVDLRD